MNREIKFRAWDKEKELMGDVLELYVGFGATASKGWNITDMDGNPDMKDDNQGLLIGSQDTRFELMQSTGLFDRTGKEIYEGDILSLKVGELRYLHEVKYRSGQFVAGLPLSLVAQEDQAKVFGNIYDNPELLDKQ